MDHTLFSGYGKCSGLTTSRYNVCPKCGRDLNPRYLISLSKMIYQGHKRFLPADNPLREGYLGKPLRHWDATSQYNTWHKNLGSCGMKRLSIFHALPYWRKLLINNLLDLMHIFKNVAQILWEHLIGN